MPLFPVPKFIEMETKILGPLVFKQVVFILITLAVCLLAIKTLPRFLANLVIFGALALGLSLAFLKIDEIPFSQYFFEGISFLFSPRKFAWGGKGKEDFAFKEIELKKENKNQIKMKKESSLEKTIVKIKTKR